MFNFSSPLEKNIVRVFSTSTYLFKDTLEKGEKYVQSSQ